MNNSKIIIILALLLIIVSSHNAFAYNYEITQISDNDGANVWGTKINSESQVAWGTYYRNQDGHAVGEGIFLYDGESVIEISEDANSGREGEFNIADNGNVVWKSDGKLYLYDGTGNISVIWESEDKLEFLDGAADGSVVFMIHLESDRKLYHYDGTEVNLIYSGQIYTPPQMNAAGSVVWRSGESDIFLYDGETTQQLTDTPYDEYAPQISDNGNVVWYTDIDEGAEVNYQVFLYDGTSVSRISEPHVSYNVNPLINANGRVIWESQYFSHRIYIYDTDGTTRFIVRPTTYPIERMSLNDKGQFTWSAFIKEGDSFGDYKIFLYDGAEIIQLADNDVTEEVNGFPQIGENGFVYWVRHDLIIGGNFHIYFYDGFTTKEIAEGSPEWGGSQFKINANGDVVWLGPVTYEDGSRGLEVFLASLVNDEVPIVDFIPDVTVYEENMIVRRFSDGSQVFHGDDSPFIVRATEPAGDAMTLQFRGLPPGDLTITPSGPTDVGYWEVSFKPDIDANPVSDVYNVRAIVTDVAGGRGSTTFNLTVIDSISAY